MGSAPKQGIQTHRQSAWRVRTEVKRDTRNRTCMETNRSFHQRHRSGLPPHKIPRRAVDECEYGRPTRLQHMKPGSDRLELIAGELGPESIRPLAQHAFFGVTPLLRGVSGCERIKGIGQGGFGLLDRIDPFRGGRRPAGPCARIRSERRRDGQHQRRHRGEKKRVPVRA